MQISEDTSSAKFQIRRYEVGQIQVNEHRYEESLIISPDLLIEDWPPQCFEELEPNHLEFLIEHQPEIALLGTGEKQAFLPAEITAKFLGLGIGLEVMNSEAACHTYQVLTSEGRSVMAAILIR